MSRLEEIKKIMINNDDPFIFLERESIDYLIQQTELAKMLIDGIDKITALDLYEDAYDVACELLDLEREGEEIE